MRGTGRLKYLPLAAVAVILVLLPVAGLTDTTLESEVRQRLGLPHPCIPTRNDSAGWSEEEPLPRIIDEPRAVALDGSIYLAGGVDKIYYPEEESNDPARLARIRVRALRTLYRFDPRSGRYEELPPMPEALSHLGFVTYRGDLYVVGGHGDRLWGGDVRADLLRYSVRDRRWQRLAPMPTPRGAVAVGVIGDRLYVAGGMVADKPLGTATSTLEIYDFKRRRWSRGAPLPRAREHVAGAVHDGRFYVLGGRNERTDALSEAARYDPETDSWEQLPPLPKPAGGFDSLAVGDGILAIGGGNDRAGTVTDAVQRFDTRTGSWDFLEPMRTARHGAATAESDGRVYVFGGSLCALFNATDEVESFDPAAG